MDFAAFMEDGEYEGMLIVEGHPFIKHRIIDPPTEQVPEGGFPRKTFPIVETEINTPTAIEYYSKFAKGDSICDRERAGIRGFAHQSSLCFHTISMGNGWLTQQESIVTRNAVLTRLVLSEAIRPEFQEKKSAPKLTPRFPAERLSNIMQPPIPALRNFKAPRPVGRGQFLTLTNEDVIEMDGVLAIGNNLYLKETDTTPPENIVIPAGLTRTVFPYIDWALPSAMQHYTTFDIGDTMASTMDPSVRGFCKKPDQMAYILAEPKKETTILTSYKSFTFPSIMIRHAMSARVVLTEVVNEYLQEEKLEPAVLPEFNFIPMNRDVAPIPVLEVRIVDGQLVWLQDGEPVNELNNLLNIPRA